MLTGIELTELGRVNPCREEIDVHFNADVDLVA